MLAEDGDEVAALACNQERDTSFELLATLRFPRRSMKLASFTSSIS